MKLPKQKIELVASTSKGIGRQALRHVNLAIEETTKGRGKTKRVERTGWLEATDSYRLVRVPVEITDEDAPGLIHRRAIETARKEKVDEIAANGAVTVDLDGGQLTLDRPSGEYPDLAKLMPSGEPVFTVGLDAALLAGLAKALSDGKSQGVILEFFGPLKAMRVSPMLHGRKQGDAEGLLMPVRLVG